MEPEVRKLLAYPLAETLAAPEAKAVIDDGFAEVAGAVLAAYESGELAAAMAQGHDGYKVRRGRGEEREEKTATANRHLPSHRWKAVLAATVTGQHLVACPTLPYA